MADSDRIQRQPTTTGAAADGGEAHRPVRHLTQAELARRWRKSERTLERWRLRGVGPAHLQIGGVLYRLVDIEEFERTQLRQKAARRSKSKCSSAADESS
jgi:Helix-turn-helix domain